MSEDGIGRFRAVLAVVLVGEGAIACGCHADRHSHRSHRGHPAANRMPSAPSAPILVSGYLVAALLVAWLAASRGRTPVGWLIIAVLLSPPLTVGLLWFLADLEHERRQTREFLNQAKQRRHRRDPHDAFSRTRERQEQEIHTKAITARHERRQRAEAAVVPQPLRTRENRTPATLIMQSWGWSAR